MKRGRLFSDVFIPKLAFALVFRQQFYQVGRQAACLIMGWEFNETIGILVQDK